MAWERIRSKRRSDAHALASASEISLNIRPVAFLTLTVLLLGAVPAWHAQSVSVTVPGVKLYGTLTVPNGPGPFPVALIIAGSGPTDRDGNGYGLNTDAYKLLANDLAAGGVATLRYDKRAIGQSAMPNLREQDLRFEQFVQDAVAFVDALNRNAHFRGIYLIGHSEGSLIGILAAQQRQNVAGLISLEGAGRNAADIVVEQVRQGGAPASVVSAVTRLSNDLRAGKTVASVDPDLAALFRASVQPYVISWFRYDPAAEIARLKMPVLIVQGTTDIQVGVEDARRLKAGDPQGTLLILPGMNHILRNAPADRAGNIATYNQPTLPLDRQAVDAMTNFILHSR